MMNRPMVSIVIAHYNQIRFLGDCVSSLLERKSPYLKEVLLIDDASTEPDVVQKLDSFENIPKVRVYRLKSNIGVQAVRNYGVEKASGDLIINLDADDTLSPFIGPMGDLFKDCSQLMTDPKLAFVHYISQMFGDCVGYTISSSPLTEELVAKKFHVPTSICFRRSDFLDGARYDLEIKKWQDWSFGVEILSTRMNNEHDNKIRFLTIPYHNYRIHGSSDRISMKSVSELLYIEKTVRRHSSFFRKHYGAGSIESIASMVLQSKPTKIMDLLYTARNDLQIALKMCEERKAVMCSPIDELGVP